MANSDDPRHRADVVARRAHQALDTVVYSVVAVAVVAVVAAVVSFPFWGVWVGVKYVLFFVGFFVFGVSTFRLRPTPPWKDDDDPAERREETRFEGFVGRVFPLGRYRLAPDDRLPAAAKLFVAGLVMLAVSFALETVFGVVA